VRAQISARRPHPMRRWVRNQTTPYDLLIGCETASREQGESQKVCEIQHSSRSHHFFQHGLRVVRRPTARRIDQPSPSSIRAHEHEYSDDGEADVQEQPVQAVKELIVAHSYRVRLNETLASTSIRTMKTSRKAMSPLTALKSAPLNRICLIALTEWVSGLKCAKALSHGGKLSTG
jgi:hypothetical protein